MHEPKSFFLQKGPTLTTLFFLSFCVFFFFVDEGREDPNTTINESSSALQRNAIKMAFRWFADDDLTFNPGYVAL